nr:hypothetical protein [Mycobacterium sp. E3298]
MNFNYLPFNKTLEATVRGNYAYQVSYEIATENGPITKIVYISNKNELTEEQIIDQLQQVVDFETERTDFKIFAFIGFTLLNAYKR